MVKELESQYSKVEYVHVARELNKVADALVNKALDAL
jgi:ribonuclease HI